MAQTIEIDCAPMTPRPDTYIADVIADTGLELKEPVAKGFGNWTWDYSEVPAEQWEQAKPILQERITKLYYDGCIRYGSW